MNRAGDTGLSIDQIISVSPSTRRVCTLGDDGYWGGIEAGGTKVTVAVGRTAFGPLKREVIPTKETPIETIKEIIKFFTPYIGELIGVGIASFGPLGLNPNLNDYGKISASTPKIGWRNYPIAKDIADSLQVQVNMTTDVNAALIGEARLGVGKHKTLDNCIYITVGTGIGAGILSNGKLTGGLSHPELGHMFIPRDSSERPDFNGVCPSHGLCLEGAASGPSIAARWKTLSENLDSTRDDIWSLEARYLAYGISNIILTTVPQMIILGGGVMDVPGLIERVRLEVKKIINNYVQVPATGGDINKYIVKPALKDVSGFYESGVRGAILLAQM